MRSKAVWTLVVLNLLLLCSLVGQWLRPNAASAQMGQIPRPSDYILVPGVVQGSPTDLVYIVDTQNHLLSARLFDGQRFQDMAPIPLDRIFGSGPGGRRTR